MSASQSRALLTQMQSRLDGGDEPTAEEWHAAVGESFKDKPEFSPLDNFNPIRIEPVEFEDGPQWSLFIPQLNATEDTDESTYWDTLEAAVLSLLIAVRNGEVKHENGKAAQ